MVMHGNEDESFVDNDGDDGDDGDDDDGGDDNGDNNGADDFYDLDCPQQKDIFLLSHLLQYHRSQYNRTAVLAGFTIETLPKMGVVNMVMKQINMVKRVQSIKSLHVVSSSTKRYDFPSSES